MEEKVILTKKDLDRLDDEFETEWENFTQFCNDNELSRKEMFKLYHRMTQKSILYEIINYFNDGDGYIKEK